MTLLLSRITYDDLKSSRQQENYNFQKLSAVLADYGFMTVRLTDDWKGADFIAQHIDGETFVKVQLKGRLTFRKYYQSKDLYLAFSENSAWYLYPHDDVLEQASQIHNFQNTSSWIDKGGYSFSYLTKPLAALLAPYKIA
jgi:hypothetical protein